jgi:hypothetical protein
MTQGYYGKQATSAVFATRSGDQSIKPIAQPQPAPSQPFRRRGGVDWAARAGIKVGHIGPQPTCWDQPRPGRYRGRRTSIGGVMAKLITAWILSGTEQTRSRKSRLLLVDKVRVGVRNTP